MTESLIAPTAGQEWRTLVQKHGTAEFASLFTKDASLETSVLNGPCVGAEQIDAFFAATSRGLYDSLTFIHETRDGAKTFLEWEGRAFGKALGGTTIVTRNGAGLIESVRLYHRPLSIVIQISAALATRLRGKVDDKLFGG